MSTFIRKVKTKSGATAVQIVYKRGSEIADLKHIGSAHNDTDLQMLLALARERMYEGQLSLDFAQENSSNAYLERSYSGLLFESLESVYNMLFPTVDDEVFKQLVLSRLIEPTSKLDTIRVLKALGLDAPSYTGIHRCLQRIVNEGYRDTLGEACFEYLKPSSLTLLLYDVTTLYFEAQREDEYRRSGLSKERRLDPQITVGLLVDHTGFPLAIQSFEGNRAEVKTLVPVLASFKARHGLENITVTADAAMLSASNILELERLGYYYIIASRLAKTPYEIDEYLSEEGAILQDGQIFESRMTIRVDGKLSERRVIHQFRQKRASLDLLNISKTVSKAENIVEKRSDMKRNRFLKIEGEKREINHTLVDQAKRKAGIKGYVTNLDAPAQLVINAYHQLFEVEKSFRMSKSDLKARPIFHHKRDSIEAHLTIVFAALAIARHIESKTKMSIRKFIKTLEPLRTGVASVNGVSVLLKPKLSDNMDTLLRLLSSSFGN